MSFFVKMTDLDRLATSGEFQEAGEVLQLDHPSRIFLDLQQEDIRSFRRENADLIVEAADGSKLKIANFYQASGDCQLYLKGDDGGLMLAVLSPVDDSGSLFSQYVALTEASPFEAGSGASSSSSSGGGAESSWFNDNWGVIGLGALALGGAGAAVVGLGGGGGSDADNTPPRVPATPNVSGNVGDAFQAGATTVVDDTQPTFSGTGTAGDTIKLYEGNTVIGQAKVAANGGWTITPATPLAEGTHSLALTATDTSGNQSNKSAAFSLTVDTDATLNGGAGNDLLIGGAGDNTLNGGAGDDKLIDGSGSDTLDGGTGSDQIVISGTGFAHIDGGSNVDGTDIDTLVADVITLDLREAAMYNKIDNIERIDLSYDKGINTLSLTSAAVDAMTDADNRLQIVGDSNDTLNALGAHDKVAGALVENGVTYDQYTFGTTTLLVDEDVNINV